MIPEIHNTYKSQERKSIILTVDDDPNNLAVVRDCLVEFNYTILVAEDGESAIKRAAYSHPDLILLDIMMPGIDGYETCRRLKSQESTKDIPVIFMTALAETEHKVKGLEVGAVDYITKPFQREELLARIAVHLHIRELTKKLQEAKDSLETRVVERTAELAQAISDLHDEIIERKLAEEERVRLATAIEQAAESIFITDAKWHINYVNPAFEETSGYTRDEIIGQHARVLQSDTHEPKFYRQLIDLIHRDDFWSGRITTKKKDGSNFEAEVTISSVRDNNGTIINYVSIHRDVTNEIRLEKELRQSQKMEAIGTLAGGIAHDFNNILTAIIGFSEIAMMKLDDDNPATHDLQRVLNACLRATSLVKQILSFSRQSEQERRPIPLTSLIEEVLKLLRSSLPSTIEIHQHISTAPKGDTVLADPTQIHQVLMNLGTNAAHAMRAKGGILSVSLSDFEVDDSLVSLYPDLTRGSYIRLSVSDTGHGMEAAVKERIFDPYFTTKKVGEGTGIGLAMVQGIIKSHGGAIKVYSEPGQGTTFHIFLPKAGGEFKRESAVDEAMYRGTERILFVDDETMLVEVAQELIESLGYTITATTNSNDALKLFGSDPNAFDLVITDMTMPELSGMELSGELMAIRPDIPIILCTGFCEQINEKQAKERGIRNFIMKPYGLSTLSITIRKALEKTVAL
jgi:two-component system cell cycle sensor histidine kinase/response regulator CckA